MFKLRSVVVVVVVVAVVVGAVGAVGPAAAGRRLKALLLLHLLQLLANHLLQLHAMDRGLRLLLLFSLLLLHVLLSLPGVTLQIAEPIHEIGCIGRPARLAPVVLGHAKAGEERGGG